MKTKKTYTQRERESRVCNQKYILTATGLDLDSHNLIMHETGCRMAETLYPANTPFAKYQKVVVYSRSYWVWWQNEWAKNERELVSFCRTHHVELTRAGWQADVEKMLTNNHVEDSYQHNYLKQVNHLI